MSNRDSEIENVDVLNGKLLLELADGRSLLFSAEQLLSLTPVAVVAESDVEPSLDAPEWSYKSSDS